MVAKATGPAGPFVVLQHCSTRETLDSDTFIRWAPGDIVETYPPHVPVKEWIDDGVWMLQPASTAKPDGGA